MKRHKEITHEGVRYPCDLCEYVAGTLFDLKQHKEIRHGGIRYLCDQCEYSASTIAQFKQHTKFSMRVLYTHVNNVNILMVPTPLSLKRHIKSKHDSLKYQYQCDLCEYSATKANVLKRHVQNQYEGIRYPCDQCQYMATRADHLKKHMKAKH